MWISLLTRYWYIAVIAVILGIFYVQHERLTICQLKVDKYEQQMSLLIKDSKVAEDRAEAVNKGAAEELQAEEEYGNDLLNDQVPRDCMGAMQWGVEQAQNVP